MTKITLSCIAFVLVFNLNYLTASTISNTNYEQSQSGEIQRIRINFVAPSGFLRQILLGFTTDNVATDDVDYGYDARSFDNYPNDCSWMIHDDPYIIQTVGAFDKTKKYPIGIFLNDSGSISLSLYSQQNFENSIDVFIYDAVLNTYTQINDVDFTTDIPNGEYLDRFFIAFQDMNLIQESASLSIEENETSSTIVNYLSNTDMLYVNTNSSLNIKSIEVYNLLGKQLFTQNNINAKSIKIPLEYINTNYGIVSVTTEKGIMSKKVVLK